MNELKPWWQSKTILLSGLGAIVALLALFDLLPEDLNQEAIVESVLVLTSAGAAVFRKVAKAKLTPTTTV